MKETTEKCSQARFARTIKKVGIFLVKSDSVWWTISSSHEKMAKNETFLAAKWINENHNFYFFDHQNMRHFHSSKCVSLFALKISSIFVCLKFFKYAFPFEVVVKIWFLMRFTRSILHCILYCIHGLISLNSIPFCPLVSLSLEHRWCIVLRLE